MAEPLTNIDIEDVLTSIRRLVAEEPARAASRPAPLMLTPALRVRADNGPRVVAPVRPADAPLPRAEAAQQSVARPGSAAVPDAAEPLPADASGESVQSGAIAGTPNRDGGEGDDRDRGRAPPLSLTGAMQEPAGAAEVQDDAAEFFAPPREAMTLEDRIADLEAAIGRSEEEFEPDGSEDPVELSPDAMVLRPAGAATSRTGWFAPARDAREPKARPAVAATTPTAAEPEPGPEPAGHPEPEAETEADASALPQPEPPVGDLPTTLGARRDDDGVGAIASEGAGPTGSDGPEVEEALIDEESLREIVAELVRQELRGELGERITRNVRRMIRRELNRALALKELDGDDQEPGA